MTDADNIPRRFQRSVHLDAVGHHFRLGQAVRLKGGVLRSSEVFIITARLPMNGDSPQYRIRTDNERFERMAIESELEAVNPSPPTDESVEEKYLSAFDRRRDAIQNGARAAYSHTGLRSYTLSASDLR